MSNLRTWLTMVLLTTAALAGCPASDDTAADVPSREDGETRDDAGDADVPDVPEVVVCTPEAIQCVGGNAQTCNATGDGWESIEACTGATPACVPDVGCLACRPGDTECVSDTQARSCPDDGSGWVTDDCDAALGESCVGGICSDLTPACEEARRNNSYEGCDYWATQTINSELKHNFDPAAEPPFRFAFVIGNRQTTTAHVRVQDSTSVVAETTVLPNTTQVIELDWNDAIRKPRDTSTPPVYHSALFPSAAYRVWSDVPVTVYQFNPLKYWVGILDGSHSNDASLLLPRHVLTGNYVAASRSTFMWRARMPDPEPDVIEFHGLPGFIAAVGVEDDTDVTVTFTAHTLAGTTGSGVDAYDPGDTATFQLEKWDVLQILTAIPAECTPLREEVHPANPYIQAGYCDLGAQYDLTGTLVQASKPIALFSGHDCSFVPYDRWACDHLEEQMFPLEAWGDHYLVSRPDPVIDEGSVYRVISREDGNSITFRPDAWIPVTLDRGEWTELESDVDFEIRGTEPLLVVQYLVGQGSEDVLGGIGDPSMSLAVPVDQYRTSYNFLAPDDYREDPAIALHGENWVNVLAPTGASIVLDGDAVTGFTVIGDSGFDAARVQIEGGSHSISSTEEFGITCYGYGNYTSYMYPGGLDVDPISPFI